MQRDLRPERAAIERRSSASVAADGRRTSGEGGRLDVGPRRRTSTRQQC